MLSLLTHQPRPFLMNKKKIYSNEFKQSVLNNIFALVCFITVRSEYICMDLLSSIKYNNIVMCNCIEKVIKVICFQSPTLAMNQGQKISIFHFILLLFILRLFCLLQIASYFPKFAWHHYLNTNQLNICERKEIFRKHF